MLVLTRKTGESIVVKGPCVVTLLESKDGKSRIGIKADREVSILRSELENQTEDLTLVGKGES